MDVLKTVLEAISEKKGRDILVFNTMPVTPYMDTMIVVTADNNRQNAAIAENIKDRLFEAGYDGIYKVEGTKDSNWILVDLREIVIHLFTASERNVYQIERLYADCEHEVYDL
ncbi:MAG: ribosome silencing factor [Erysipelotrichaceae bacterium]|nr:ribosome silencing factor [Erysipelotrichaceae bacterium]